MDDISAIGCRGMFCLLNSGYFIWMCGKCLWILSSSSHDPTFQLCSDIFLAEWFRNHSHYQNYQMVYFFCFQNFYFCMSQGRTATSRSILLCFVIWNLGPNFRVFFFLTEFTWDVDIIGPTQRTLELLNQTSKLLQCNCYTNLIFDCWSNGSKYASFLHFYRTFEYHTEFTCNMTIFKCLCSYK